MDTVKQAFLNVIREQTLEGLKDIEELEAKVAPDGGETVLPLNHRPKH